MGFLRFVEPLNRWLRAPEMLTRVQRLAILYGVLFLATSFILSWLTPGLAYGPRGVIGADFLAFYTAGDMTLQGRALEAYDFAAFDAALQTRVENENLGLMWQYPPLMFLIAGVLALLPYKVSLWLWILATGVTFAWAASRILAAVVPNLSERRLALLLILTSPLCMMVVTSGQISLFTAALLMVAVFRPRTHWVLAGIAAGLLTLKPQLGVLIPLAFLAAGAWRAISVATITAILLHGLSALVFGPDSFIAFFDAVVRLQSDVAGSGVNTPPVNMTTLFGQLRVWDVPSSVAMSIHVSLAGLVVVATAYHWYRHARNEDQALYLVALLGAGAILVTPYAYAYEMTALVPAAIWFGFKSERYRTVTIVLLSAAWLLLVLRRFLELDGVMQMPFLISISVFLLMTLAGFEQRKAGATRD